MKRAFSVAGALAVGAGIALADDRPRSNPGDPKAPVPESEHRSALKDYRRFVDEDVASWREVNDEVARVGGHAGVFRADAPPPPESKRPKGRP